MAKKSPFNINSFLKLSGEEQAKVIEKETQKLLSRLPSLKKSLKMYNDTSDEMYNLQSDEIELQGMAYSRAVRTGSITTPTGKQAYQNFVKNLHKYTRRSIKELAIESAERRMSSWLEHIEQGEGVSAEGIELARSMLEQMTPELKMGFTRSKYFMDSSYMYMVVGDDGNLYPVQLIKLQVYLESKGIDVEHIYTLKRDKKG